MILYRMRIERITANPAVAGGKACIRKPADIDAALLYAGATVE
jgi:hypothetical protein